MSRPKVPLDKDNNYSAEIVASRQQFIQEQTGVKLEHLSHYSFDPERTRGNIENFTGVAQIPIGFAGPVLIDGMYAKGEFYIPLATTEGTLVASYNRGMKVLNQSGGIKTTVSGDAMQRAPVFIFDDARKAREFALWIDENYEGIKQTAESTTRVGKLVGIEKYHSNKFMFLRFNFRTGDAAGQNMVGRATFFACEWIRENCPLVGRYYLESNFATDKKGSYINTIMTRGKRVTAEATVPRQLLIEQMRTSPETLHYHHQVSQIAGFISGVNNNGAHSPNGITAMFIATGQDVANVAESSAGVLYVELTPDNDLYMSITIPSLIVATYGGGTGLPTQRECLEILGCAGPGNVYKFAEIVCAVVLAGELSLGAAVSSLDWVTSHEQYGRNR
jgi:hydroxymethylglutaryl-CoA reductase (NADPH)